MNKDKPMTADEFLSYWLDPIDDEGPHMSALDAFEESLFEHESQYYSECAMFGDAGPGQGLHVSNGQRELENVRRQINRIKTLKGELHGND